MPTRTPPKPKFKFSDEKIAEFAQIIAERLNTQLEPGVNNLQVQGIVAKLVSEATRKGSEARDFREELLQSPRATIIKFVDACRSHQDTLDWRRTRSRPQRSHCISAQPDDIQRHFERYGEPDTFNR
ncbi:MAG: hypothetical protein K2Q01_05825 [Rickettsiales bacterium]|nr:hypothetical protein [Rickettsiales bacterium]